MVDNQKNLVSERVLIRIKTWISTTGLSEKPTFTALAGDGSTRQFFRMSFPTFSKILLIEPLWQSSRDYPSVQQFLSSLQLPVPEFHLVEQELGFLIMSDLGDELLQNRLISNPNSKMSWLFKTSNLLAELHGKTYPVPNDLPAAKRCFDAQKFKEELLFTLEHLVQGLLAMPSFSKQRMCLLDRFCDDLKNIPPSIFLHRDFHSRNLLIYEENLFMIDFQDARLGPPHYDLASLIFDSYFPLSQRERVILFEKYQASLKPFPLYQLINWDSFWPDLAMIAFQRIVKAAGSFASFFTRHKKTSHLRYILPALNNALFLCNTFHNRLGPYSSLFEIEKWIEKAKSHPSIVEYSQDDL